MIHQIKYIILLLFTSTSNFFSQNTIKIDSLINLLPVANDTGKVKVLINLALEYKNNKNQIIYYSESAVKLAETLPDKKFTIKAWKNLAKAFFRYENYNQALLYTIKIQKYYEKIGNEMQIANSGMEIGKIYFSMGNYEKALNLYQEALPYFEKENNKSAKAACLTNIGIVFHTLNKTEEAISYYLKAIKIYEEINDKNNVANLLVGIGDIESDHGNYETVEKYYSKALQSFKDIDDKNGCAKVLSAWGDLNVKKGDLVPAIEKYSKAFNIGKSAGSMSVMKTALEGLSDAYEKSGNYKVAYQTIKKLFSVKDSILNKENLQQLNEVQGKFESEKKQKEIALLKETGKNKTITIYFFITGFLLITVLSLIILNRYTIKQKSTKIIQNKNKELELLSIVASETENVILIMDADGKLEWVNDSFVKLNAITLPELKKLKGETIFEISNNSNIRNIIEKSVAEKAPVVYESLNKTSEGKTVWESSTLTPIFDETGKLKKLIIIDTDITARKVAEEIIKEKNKDITDSINYAERIQRSFMATKETLDENLREYFVLFKPKDVVSGDFYWAATAKASFPNGQRDLFYLVTADSTGHGVPGAIMSLLNITSLEKAIETCTDPADILNATRKTIIERLKKDGSEFGGKDGMDASLTAYDFKHKKLIVAAANNPIWIIRGGEIITIKPDKMPVGKHEKDNISFSQQEIDLQTGDLVYTLTDGFSDQFGGLLGKKFMSKNLKELLVANAHLPMHEQKLLLEKTFANWKGNLEQVDDVCIIGIRL